MTKSPLYETTAWSKVMVPTRRQLIVEGAPLTEGWAVRLTVIGHLDVERERAFRSIVAAVVNSHPHSVLLSQMALDLIRMGPACSGLMHW